MKKSELVQMIREEIRKTQSPGTLSALSPTTAKALKTSGMSEGEAKDIQRAAQATWQYIGGDVLEMNGGHAISRDEVIEAVLDADYMQQHVKDKALYRKFSSLKYAAQIALIVPAFPLKRYGM